MTLAPPLAAQTAADVPGATTSGLANATVLIIRHAEKPWSGPGLTARGRARADAYPRYLQSIDIDGRPVHVDALVAAADSPRSERPRLTLEPLGQSLAIPIQQPFRSHAVRKLVDWLKSGRPDRTILIAWHHGDVPRLLAAFGQDPAALLPHGRWPRTVYNRVIILRFDAAGALVPTASEILKQRRDWNR